MRKFVIDLIIISGLIVMIILFATGMKQNKTEGAECVADPFTFGVIQMNEFLDSEEGFCECLDNNSCVCDPQKFRYVPFRVTKDGRTPITQEAIPGNYSFNLNN